MLWQYADVLCWKKNQLVIWNAINWAYFWSVLSLGCFPVQHCCGTKQNSLVSLVRRTWSLLNNNNNKDILIFTMTAYLTALAAAPVSDQIVDILCRASEGWRWVWGIRVILTPAINLASPFLLSEQLSRGHTYTIIRDLEQCTIDRESVLGSSTPNYTTGNPSQLNHIMYQACAKVVVIYVLQLLDPYANGLIGHNAHTIWSFLVWLEYQLM